MNDTLNAFTCVRFKCGLIVQNLTSPLASHYLLYYIKDVPFRSAICYWGVCFKNSINLVSAFTVPDSDLNRFWWYCMLFWDFWNDPPYTWYKSLPLNNILLNIRQKIIFEIICFYQDGLRLVPHIIQPPHACCYGDSTMQHIQKAFLKISMLYLFACRTLAYSF